VGNEAAIRTGGDWDLRGPDFETLLIGPIMATTIDADRLVRNEWSNGFPNWAMYRCFLAGDSHLRKIAREWAVAFAIAAAGSGAVSRRKASDEFACLAGWDAYHAMLTGQWVASGADVAEIAEVDPKTYRKLRGYVFSRLKASLDEYWIRMQVAFRQAAMMERWVDHTPAPNTFGLARGFENDAGMGSSNGCYITPRRGSGC
jgi:hypothetical protein